MLKINKLFKILIIKKAKIIDNKYIKFNINNNKKLNKKLVKLKS